jgi:uncharacterized Zn-binding protein involved in type VI secretion
MNNAIRKGDKDSAGHIVITNIAKTVQVNNLPAATKLSKLNDGESIVTASKTVTIENNPAVRVGDKTNKGYLLIKGSNDVIIG